MEVAQADVHLARTVAASYGWSPDHGLDPKVSNAALLERNGEILFGRIANSAPRSGAGH